MCVYSVECDTIATAEFGGRRTRPARPVAAVQLAGASAKIHTLAAAQRRLYTSQTARARCTMEPECVHTHKHTHIPIYKLRVVGRLAHTHTHTPTLNLDEPAAAASLLRLRHSITRGRLLLLLGLVYIFFCVRARIDFGVFSSLLDVCIPPMHMDAKSLLGLCVLCCCANDDSARTHTHTSLSHRSCADREFDHRNHRLLAALVPRICTIRCVCRHRYAGNNRVPAVAHNVTKPTSRASASKLN